MEAFDPVLEPGPGESADPAVVALYVTPFRKVIESASPYPAYFYFTRRRRPSCLKLNVSHQGYLLLTNGQPLSISALALSCSRRWAGSVRRACANFSSLYRRYSPYGTVAHRNGSPNRCDGIDRRLLGARLRGIGRSRDVSHSGQCTPGPRRTGPQKRCQRRSMVATAACSWLGYRPAFAPADRDRLPPYGPIYAYGHYSGSLISISI